MKYSAFFLACTFSMCSGYAHASEVYPKNAVTRLFGTNQGNVGDCLAESQTTALETAFAERGLEIRFSLFYRHARNWMTADLSKIADAKLQINDADRATLNHNGSWIPDFMWPEDNEGYNGYATGDRPHVSEAAVVDPDFKPIESFGYSATERFYQGGFRNSGNFNDLKKSVDARLPVTISVHTVLLEDAATFSWSEVTGLLNTAYNWDALVKAVARQSGDVRHTLTHSVAVVGYDDALYANRGDSVPGAFIVRNSWNDQDRIDASESSSNDPSSSAEFQSMRGKISDYNLPGYYAIPYQYFIDQFRQGTDGSYIVYNLDFNGFAAQYDLLSGRYQELHAPFVCNDGTANFLNPAFGARDLVRTYKQNLAVIQNSQATAPQRSAARSKLIQAIEREASRSDESIFSYAKLARNVFRGSDRLKEFYTGQFNAYYCANTSTTLFPNVDLLAVPSAQNSLNLLSDDVASNSSWLAFLGSMSELFKNGQ